MSTPPFILDAESEPDLATMGGKACALARMAAAGIPAPPWIAVAPAAFHSSLPADGTFDPALPESWRGFSLAATVRTSLESALARAGLEGERLAVRSSAAEEDAADRSYAGQFESFLFVRPDEVADYVVRVWQSGAADRVAAYRGDRDAAETPFSPPAVLIQKMVDAEAAGVAFSVDPVSGAWDTAVVSAVYGLGSSLVGGESDADTYRIDRNGRILERTVAEKRTAHRLNREAGGGIHTVPVPPADQRAPAITDTQASAAADLARRCARLAGLPQDIEWALEDGKIHLLQSRPVTALARLRDPGGIERIWDNSNIVESYGGVSSTLTFSFARHVYEGVYRQFCLLLGVRRAVVEDNRAVFAGMLGRVRGRIYYNLLHWYRMLALLPGFSVNARFMEQMMGVREGLPESVLGGLRRQSARDRAGAAIDFALSLGGLVRSHWTLDRSIRKFHRRLEEALADPDGNLGDLRADELAAVYRRLESRLITRWDAPLVNDFFAMIYYGLLKTLTGRWCRDEAGTLQNGLLCGAGEIISAQPARRLTELARLAAAEPGFPEILCQAPPAKVMREVRRRPDFSRAARAYLDQFGDRCLEELKLESATLEDDPLLLYRSAGQLARRYLEDGTAADPEPPSAEGVTRTQAENELAERLSGHPLRKLVFRFVLTRARRRVRDRENLRFERTRLFGRVRRIFLEIGRRFHAYGILDDPRDILHLDLFEALGYIEGTATTLDLRGLAALRRREYERFLDEPAPPERFVTRGIVCQGNEAPERQPVPEDPGGADLAGIGCCPGVVRGRVRVVRNPRQAEMQNGEILVAAQTDPGWILLFPLASGLLVERGSLLSHSAIVSREMGIPSVVAVPGLLARLRTGDDVEFDGTSGKIRILDRCRHE